MALLLLSLMSILGLGMVVSVGSDMLINGYYGNYRSSYYAADTGLNVARQQFVSNVLGTISSASPYCASYGAANTNNGNCTYYPIALDSIALGPKTIANNAISNATSSFSSFNTIKSGQAANSWPGQFEINTGATSLTPVTWPTANCGAVSPCNYVFRYTVTAVGKGSGPQQVTTTETGQLLINVTGYGTGTAGGSSFSSYGAFINNFQANTSPFVTGTLTGPYFTNGAWNFGSSGSYIFTGQVGQAEAKASYDFTGNGCNPYCYVDSAGSSATYKGVTIAPTFEQGFTTGDTPVLMPANDYSQQWAVYDGYGCGEGSNVCGNASSPAPPTVTNSTLNSWGLSNVAGTVYPSSGTSSGVYFNYNTSTDVLSGGGFYVAGNADSIVLTPGTDSHGNPTQSYAITQGNVVTTITTNVAANTTTVSAVTTTTTTSHGHTTTTTSTQTLNLTGVPMDKATASGTAAPATMVYVDGNIGTSNSTGLSGPGSETAPAIQNGVQTTIVANGNINVVGNLLYEQEPVTLTTADTLIPANNHNQVLGLFTQNGNLQLYSPYNDSNLEIDAAIAAIGSSNCPSNSCGLETLNTINTFTIVGARAEANAHSVSMSRSNTYYDQRFAPQANPLNTFAPPWFPASSVNPFANATAAAPTITWVLTQRNWNTTPQNGN